ncbi:MAG: putative acyltransferase [Acidobacteriaceae bacterium]|nr:putative acyltransferase [Acidobacteriaceae bacterium]
MLEDLTTEKPEAHVVDVRGRERAKVFQSLQAGRGLAALMVIFYHCEGIISLTKYWHFSRHYFRFGASGVDFFFVLSGIVIFYAHQSDIGKPGKLREYAWKRFRRIYPIYWVVLLALLPLYFYLPSFGSGFEREPGAILDSLLLMPLTRIETIVPVAWTLYHEVMFYVIFSYLLISRRLGVTVLAFWFSASVAALVFPPQNALVATYFSPLHLLFGMGLLIPLAMRRVSFSGLPLAIVGIAGFVVCCILEDLRRPGLPNLSLAFGAFSAVALMGLMLLETATRLKFPRFLIFLGDASYSIYLVHYTALSATAKIVYRFCLRHPVPMPIPFAAMALMALGFGIAVHMLVERPLLRLLPRTIR